MLVQAVPVFLRHISLMPYGIIIFLLHESDRPVETANIKFLPFNNCLSLEDKSISTVKGHCIQSIAVTVIITDPPAESVAGRDSCSYDTFD